MHKIILAASAVILAFGGPAFAANETWLVTEENIAGVKGSQGTWTVKIDGDKINGAASMQEGNGRELTYKLEGSIAGGIYTVSINDRSDGKKGCVWNGHPPAGASAQTTGLIGYADCEGAKLIIRASIVGR